MVKGIDEVGSKSLGYNDTVEELSSGCGVIRALFSDLLADGVELFGQVELYTKSRDDVVEPLFYKLDDV